MQTKTLTVKVTTSEGGGMSELVLPGPINRLLALGVHYDAACPDTTGMSVQCSVPAYKELLCLMNRNTDLPLSQVTEVEVDPSGAARAEPCTKPPLVGGVLNVSVSVPPFCDPIVDAVTVTAVVEV
ncbi:MAG: hypothetical protein MUP14_01915 [Dehalococcoidia bacterium]|nr:hypothetical protein [Dehalococcoidia bacterium]